MHLSTCGLSPNVRKSEIRIPGNFCQWNPESWALESGISIKIGILNPSLTDEENVIQYLESGIRGVESRVQDRLGFPCMYMGQVLNQIT